jgi:hypothetical protein
MNRGVRIRTSTVDRVIADMTRPQANVSSDAPVPVAREVPCDIAGTEVSDASPFEIELMLAAAASGVVSAVCALKLGSQLMAPHL